jgi:potassium-transporting ATPase potassium-binding subunit
MNSLDLLRIVLILGTAPLLAMPMGKYFALAYSLEPTRLDRYFEPIENIVYRLCGVDARVAMSWQKIVWHFLFMVMLFCIIGYAILRLQEFLPLNPDGLGPIEPTLAFNTALSFASHAELQHYSGEVQFTTFTQMAFVLFMMFGPVATGMAIAMPMLRGFTGQSSLGNFHQDMVRTIVRMALPISFVMTLVFVALGLPLTLTARIPVQTLEGAQQIIATGPVAVIESTKQFLSNGGGFFSTNTAHPYENPSPLTDVIHLVSMMVIPGSLVVMVGHMLRNRRHGWFLYGSLFAILVALSVANIVLEKQGNPALERVGLSQSMGNMEGKEVRFGVTDSSLFTAITGATMTGAVNTMHDTLTPLGGLIPLIGILVNAVFGETGAGIVSIFLHLTLTVFIAGLMVGRTPELFGKQIENAEMKLVVKLFLIIPLVILVPLIVALFTRAGTAAISNPGAHGFTQVFYEYASSVSSNGSGFEGLGDNTPFWNISTGIVMLLGRCVPMIIMLAIGGSLHEKRLAPVTAGTIKIDSVPFQLMFIGTVIVVGALSYFPFLVLGPISEWLQIR